MKRINHFYMLLMACWLWSCQKESTPCSHNWVSQIKVLSSDPCLATGSIEILAPTGAGFLYKIEGRSYQASTTFKGIKPGKYTVSIKEGESCETTKSVVVDTLPKGVLMGQVMQILQARCSSCHAGNNPQAGINLSLPCDVVQHWQRIEARAILGLPSPMPQTGLIPIEERNKIKDWIAAGHGYQN